MKKHVANINYIVKGEKPYKAECTRYEFNPIGAEGFLLLEDSTTDSRAYICLQKILRMTITEKEGAVALAPDKQSVKVDIAGEYKLAGPVPQASYVMAEALIDSLDKSVTGIPRDQDLRYVYDKENLYAGVKYPGVGAVGPCYKVKIYTENTLQLQESFIVPMAMQEVYRIAYDNSAKKIY